MIKLRDKASNTFVIGGELFFDTPTYILINSNNREIIATMPKPPKENASASIDEYALIELPYEFGNGSL